MFEEKKIVEEKAPEIDPKDAVADESNGWCSPEFPQGCVINEEDS